MVWLLAGDHRNDAAFSTLVAFDGAVRLSLVPPRIDAVVGATWDAQVKAEIDNRLRSNPVSVDSIDWSAEPAVALVVGRDKQGATFTCTKPGKGRYDAEISLGVEDLAVRVGTVDLFSKEDAAYTEDWYLFGRATCAAPPPTAAELTLACVLIAHSPFLSFPSFTTWLLQFLKSIRPCRQLHRPS